MNPFETVQTLQERLPEYRRQYAVKRLGIFGSVARGEANPSSDLDVLVSFEGPPTFDG